MRRLALPFLLLSLLLPRLAAAGDCGSPRAAMQTFLDNLQPDNDRPLQAIACFDWSRGPVNSDERVQRVRELKSVLDGRGLYVDYEVLPSSVDPEDLDTRERFLPLPTLPEVAMIEQDGRWLFTSATVRRIPGLLDATYILPLQRFAQRLPAVFQAPVLGVETWRLIALALLIGLAVVVARLVELISSLVIKRVVGRFFDSWDAGFEQEIVRRGSWILTAGLVALLLPSLGLPVRLNQLLYLLARTLASVAAVLIAVSLVDLLSDGLQRRADRTETKMDDQLIPLLRRSAKLLVVVIGTLFVLQNLSVDVSSLLGSLAIGGLAFSLAAKDTVANLFGSVTIFTDRPFQIGDWVLIDGVEGVVEEVGFRSTRLRTFADSIVTMPNSKVADAVIDNQGRRRYRRFKTMLGLTYDTSAQQMRDFVEGVREAIRNHPGTRETFEVHFNGMGASSLDVLVYCFFTVDTWTAELAARQDLLIEFMRVADRVGVEFAFPTQTLWLEGLEKGAED